MTAPDPALPISSLVIYALFIFLGITALVMLSQRLRQKDKQKTNTPKQRLTTTFQSAAKSPPQAKLLLTPRETEVAQLVARGHSNKEIAQQLGLSVNTVQNHLKRIFTKLNIRSRVELVRRLQHLAENQISPPDVAD